MLIFVTFAKKSAVFNILQQNETIFDIGNGQREEIKRKWENVESESLSISSLSLHLTILSPFSHSQAGRLAQLVQPWP